MPNSFSSFKILIQFSNCNFLFFIFGTSISVSGSDFSEKKTHQFQ
jgi:hypothetical protein